jgi:hypothetical protein
MSRNVGEAATGTNQIVQNITGVAQAAQSTASGATQTQAAAQELARLAAEVQSAIGQFKYGNSGEIAPMAKPNGYTSAAALRAALSHQSPTHRAAGVTLHTL